MLGCLLPLNFYRPSNTVRDFSFAALLGILRLILKLRVYLRLYVSPELAAAWLFLHLLSKRFLGSIHLALELRGITRKVHVTE
jgi:hypothetical protein